MQNEIETVTMTLLELEKYINSKSKGKLIYTHENGLGGVLLRINFDAVVVSRFTNRILFFDKAKGRATDPGSNYLLIGCIEKITVESPFPAYDTITITANYPSPHTKYAILFDYEFQENN